MSISISPMTDARKPPSELAGDSEDEAAAAAAAGSAGAGASASGGTERPLAGARIIGEPAPQTPSRSEEAKVLLQGRLGSRLAMGA
jgi:hypothetical protein